MSRHITGKRLKGFEPSTYSRSRTERSSFFGPVVRLAFAAAGSQRPRSTARDDLGASNTEARRSAASAAKKPLREAPASAWRARPPGARLAFLEPRPGVGRPSISGDLARFGQRVSRVSETHRPPPPARKTRAGRAKDWGRPRCWSRAWADIKADAKHERFVYERRGGLLPPERGKTPMHQPILGVPAKALRVGVQR